MMNDLPSTTNSFDEINPYAAPVEAAIMPPSQGEIAIWRQGKVLVLRRGSSLPDVCIKSNEPAEGSKLKRSLFWHHPAVYFALLANLIPYVILATVLGKRETIEIGISDRWRRIRRRRMWIAWLGSLSGIGSCVGSFWIIDPTTSSRVFIGGLVASIGFAIYGILSARLVRAKKIDETYIYLLGAHPDYLDRFESL